LVKLIHNIPSANDSEQNKDNNNNNNIIKYLEFNKDSLLIYQKSITKTL
jgi:hypothetical protein